MTLKQTNPPNLSDVLAQLKRDTQSSLNAVQIGIIESFDATNQTATLRMAIKQVESIEPDGTRLLKEHPLVLECPVMTLFGGDSFISMPIEAGDSCIVLFNDREIDNWLYKGGVLAPSSGRIHNITDAIAIVGIRNFQESITDFLTDGIRISYAATSRMDLSQDAIDSIAALFTHTGDMTVTGDLTVNQDALVEGNSTTEGNHTVQGGMAVWGAVTGNGAAAVSVDADITFTAGKTMTVQTANVGDGTTGTFTNSVTVVNGIVTGGS